MQLTLEHGLWTVEGSPRRRCLGDDAAAQVEGRWRDTPEGVWCASADTATNTGSPRWSRSRGTAVIPSTFSTTTNGGGRSSRRPGAIGPEEVVQPSGDDVVVPWPLPAQLRAAMDLVGVPPGPGVGVSLLTRLTSGPFSSSGAPRVDHRDELLARTKRGARRFTRASRPSRSCQKTSVIATISTAASRRCSARVISMVPALLRIDNGVNGRAQLVASPSPLRRLPHRQRPGGVRATRLRKPGALNSTPLPASLARTHPTDFCGERGHVRVERLRGRECISFVSHWVHQGGDRFFGDVLPFSRRRLIRPRTEFGRRRQGRTEPPDIGFQRAPSNSGERSNQLRPTVGCGSRYRSRHVVLDRFESLRQGERFGGI